MSEGGVDRQRVSLVEANGRHRREVEAASRAVFQETVGGFILKRGPAYSVPGLPDVSCDSLLRHLAGREAEAAHGLQWRRERQLDFLGLLRDALAARSFE